MHCYSEKTSTFVKPYKVPFGNFFKENNMTKIESTLLTILAYPGVGVRYLMYGTKRPVKALMEDGHDINAFAFLWLAGMVFCWSSIANKIS